MTDRPRHQLRTDAAIIGLVLVVLAPWVVVGRRTIELTIRMLAHPSRLDSVDVLAMLPLWCVVVSIVLLVVDGPSRAPRLEPSMLAAVPLFLVGTLLLWLGPTRYGFAFWQSRIDVWVLATAMLATTMLAFGVRYMLARGAWGLWLLAFPPVALVVAQVWRAVSTWIADIAGAGNAPGWIRVDVDGLLAAIVAGSIVAFTPQLLPGHRARASVLGVALVTATSLGRARAWLDLGGDPEQVAVLSGIRFVLVVSLVVLVVATLRARGPERERFERHGIRWTPRYLAVATSTVAVALLAVATITTSEQFRRDIDVTGRLRTATVEFGSDDIASAPIPERRSLLRVAATVSEDVGAVRDGVTWDDARRFQRRADCADVRMPFCTRLPNVDVGQQPFPWNRMQLHLAQGEACHARRAPWYLDVFDEMPVVVPFVVVDRDAGADATIRDGDATWVLVLPSASRSASTRVRVGERFRVHMARSYRTRQVVTDGGAVTMQLLRHHGMPFAAASFSMSAVGADGTVMYLTFVVARRAETTTRSTALPRAGSRSQQLAYRGVDALLSTPDRSAPRVHYTPAALDVLEVVDSIVEGLADTSRPHGDVDTSCATRIDYEPMPTVELLDQAGARSTP